MFLQQISEECCVLIVCEDGSRGDIISAALALIEIGVFFYQTSAFDCTVAYKNVGGCQFRVQQDEFAFASWFAHIGLGHVECVVHREMLQRMDDNICFGSVKSFVQRSAFDVCKCVLELNQFSLEVGGSLLEAADLIRKVLHGGRVFIREVRKDIVLHFIIFECAGACFEVDAEHLFVFFHFEQFNETNLSGA